jgi:hypothetical protein
LREEPHDEANWHVEQKGRLKGQLESLDKEIGEVFALHRQMAGAPGVDLVRDKLANLSAQKTALNSQLSEIEDYIANVPTAKAARSLIERGMQDFLGAWKKGTASQQKRLLGRLPMRLRVTAKGLGVRYQWTSPDDARSLAPEYKKALEFSSEASVSNLHYLDQYRRGHQVPQGGGHVVFCADTHLPFGKRVSAIPERKVSGGSR